MHTLLFFYSKETNDRSFQFRQLPQYQEHDDHGVPATEMFTYLYVCTVLENDSISFSDLLIVKWGFETSDDLHPHTVH